MKSRRILYITRIVKGGVEVVVDQLARGIDRDRYEAIMLFDPEIQSNIRERLSNSGIKTVDLMKCGEEQVTRLPDLRKNRDGGARVEACFGTRAGQLYFSLKYFQQIFAATSAQDQVIRGSYSEKQD